MTQEHSFFIPDVEYLKDLEGFIKYLGEKVGVGNVCLHCNGKGRSFWSLEAVQAHMRDLSHCKLDYEGNEEEYEDYYDFSVDYNGDGTTGSPQVESPVKVSEDGTELIFKDGKAVGHRSLVTYYRQKYKPADTRDSIIINSLIHKYKALGWKTNQPHVPNEKGHKHDQQQHAQHHLKLGVKANKLQPHFRYQIGLV